MGKIEEWKNIEGYPGYKISSFGRVKSNDRILKGSSYKGYVKVVLHNGNLKRAFYVHRLVAKNFIDNPENKPCVNHIDNNPSNNNSSNLEWCTKKENSEWMCVQGRNKRTKTWINRLHKSQRKTYKAVIAENIKTGEKMYFDRLNSVSERGFSPSTVCQCCKLPPQSKIHKGYYFQYAYDPETSTPDKKRLLKEKWGVEVG